MTPTEIAAGFRDHRTFAEASFKVRDIPASEGGLVGETVCAGLMERAF